MRNTGSHANVYVSLTAVKGGKKSVLLILLAAKQILDLWGYGQNLAIVICTAVNRVVQNCWHLLLWLYKKSVQIPSISRICSLQSDASKCLQVEDEDLFSLSFLCNLYLETYCRKPGGNAESSKAIALKWSHSALMRNLVLISVAFSSTKQTQVACLLGCKSFTLQFGCQGPLFSSLCWSEEACQRSHQL